MKPSSSERSFGSLPPKKRELVHGSRVPENEREREGSSEISIGTHNRAEGLNWLAAVATSQTRPPSTTCGQAFDTPIDLVQNQHQQHVAGLFGPQAPSASAVTATGRSTSPTYSLSHLSRPYPAPTPVYSDQQGLPYPSSHVPPPYNTLQYVGSSYAAAVAAAYPPGTAAFLHPTFLAPGAPDSYPALLSSAGTAQGFSTSTQGLVATHHYLGAGSSASAYAVPRGLPLHPATLVSPQPLSHGVSAVHLSPESSFLHLSGRSSSPLPLRGRDHSPAEAANGGRMPIVSGLRRGRQLYSPHSDGETEGLASQSPSNQPYLSDPRGQPITSDVEIRPLSRPGVILCPSTSHPSDVDREHLPSRHSSTHYSDPHPSLIPPQSSDATDPTYINWQTADFNYYANAQQVVLGEGGRPMLVAMVSAEVPGEKARSSYVREVVSPSDRRHENNPAASCSTGVLQPSHSSFLSSNTAFQATSSSVTSQNHHRQQQQQQVPATFSQTPPAVTTPPAHFYRGSVIQMAGGELKRVEELVTEDFVRSAEASKELKLDSSTVTATGPGSAPGLALLRFAIGETRTPASIQVLAEHPFFVFGRGWASCFPEQTSQQIGLPCTKLAVGDVCISLALRSSHTTLLSSATAIHSGQDASPSGRLWEPGSSTSFYQGLGTALIQPSFESHNHPQSHSQSKSTTAISSRESISSVSLSVATHNDRHQHHCEDPESHYTRLHHQHHLCRSQIVPQRKDTPGSCRLEMRSGSGGGICSSQAADAARTQIAHRDLVPHIVHKTVVTAMKKPPISRTMDLSPARRERPGSEVDLGSGQRWHPETRDGRFEVAGSQPVRKRRWSAPECGEHRILRSSDSMQNRPMFISREVKVSIEGHSSTGR